MATVGNNLSGYDPATVPDGADFRIAIAVSEWNGDVTGNLRQGAEETLLRHGVKPENLTIVEAPGSFELPLTAQWLIEAKKPHAVIVIGSVIQGETRHFDFVCEATSQGTKDVSLKYGVPVIFCVLTDNTWHQAAERSGGRLGNKGVESAVAALKMAALGRSLR